MFNCKYLTYINMGRNRRVTSLAMCLSHKLLIKEQSSKTYTFATLLCSPQNIKKSESFMI